MPLQAVDGKLVLYGGALKIADSPSEPCCCDCDSCPPCPWTEAPTTITFRITLPATNAGPPPPCVDELCDATAGNLTEYILEESGVALTISGTSGCVSSGTTPITIANGLDDILELCDPDVPGDSATLERLAIGEIDPPIDCVYETDLGGCGGDLWTVTDEWTEAWHQTLLQLEVYFYCAEEGNPYGLTPGPYTAYEVFITQEFFARGTETSVPPEGCGELGDTCYIDGTLAYGHSFFTWDEDSLSTIYFMPGCTPNRDATIPLYRSGDGSGPCDRTPGFHAELELAW